MLALIVGLLLPPGYPLPDPSLPVSMRPALPLSTLQGATPAKVYRGSYWRRGEYQRITFAYRLQRDPNRKVTDIAREKDFVPAPLANPSSPTRVVRELNGVRQTVGLIDIQGTEQYGWAPVLGKGQFAIVTEMPSQYPVTVAWSAHGLSAPPPLPPHYPPTFKFLRQSKLDNVMADSFISGSPRLTYSIQVVLETTEPFAQVQENALAELKPMGWEGRKGKTLCGLRLLDAQFGLVGISLEEAMDKSQPDIHSIIRLSYIYRDNIHSPRIE